MRRRILTAFLLLVMLFTTAAGSLSVRAGDEPRTVKVGYWDHSKNFVDISDGRSGYAYDYMRAIANFAYWDVEFIYDSYERLLEMVADGQIDIILGADSSEASSSLLDYSSYPILSEQYRLFVDDGSRIITGDYSYIDGGSIAIYDRFNYLLDDWLKELGIAPNTVVLCKNSEEVMRLLASGEVDAALELERFLSEDTCMGPVAGRVDYYFGVSKKSEGLLLELNNAQTTLLSSSAGFLDELEDKYRKNIVSVSRLSTNERKMLDEKKELVIGTLSNNSPYSDYKNGQGVSGLVDEVVSLVKTRLSIEDTKISYEIYDTYEAMIEGLNDGSVDMIFPVSDSVAMAGEKGYMQTRSIASRNVSLVFPDSFDDSMFDRVAVAGGGLLVDYVSETYPKAGMIIFSTDKECLDAVMEGTADCAIVSTQDMNSFAQENTYYINLRVLTLPIKQKLCFAVKRGNTTMFSLANRGVSMVSEVELNQMDALLSAQDVKASSTELYVVSHRKLIVGQIMAMSGMAVLVICFALVGLRNRKVSRKLQNTSEELQAEVKGAVDKETIISSLADKYEFVCYIDSLSNMIRVLRVKGIFTSHINPEADVISSTEFDRMLNSMIMPMDIHAFREATDREEAMEAVRKKGSYYTTFRMLDDDGGKYYRANFAMDRDSPDGMILGFANVDEEIRRENKRNSDMEKRDVLVKNCIATTLDCTSSDQAIIRVLDLVAGFYHGDRAYIFETNRDRTMISNTYEFCWKDVSARHDRLQNIDISTVKEWLDELEKQSAVYLTVSEDESCGRIVNEFFETPEVTSLIAAPLALADEVIGFIGIDNPKERCLDMGTIGAVGNIIQGEILRRKQSGEEHTILNRLVDAYMAVFYVNLQTGYIHNYSIAEEYVEAFGTIENYEGAMQKFVEDYVDPEYRGFMHEFLELSNIMARLKEEEEITGFYTTTMLDRDYYAEAHFMRTNPEGTCAVLCFVDRTEQTREEIAIQNELKAAKDMAVAANNAKSSFLSKMSHDIRTPINGVIGMTEIATRHLDDSERVEDCLNKIDSASHHLLSLVNDVLDMSRIESGKTTISSDPVNMNSFFNNCIIIIQAQLEEKAIRLEKDFTEFSCPDVIADELHLRQVLINILGNALKYTPQDGRIILRAHEAAIDEDHVAYHIEVEDNGIGIKQDFLTHIFEEFSQEDEGTRTEYKGTGLGLAIAKQLIEMMGGTIGVRSTEGVGTTFTLDVEFKIDHDRVHTEYELPEADIHGAKILLVEDNPLNLEIAEELLSMDGAEVTTASDGKLAVDAFAGSALNYYDVILMDIMMPNMNGIEATKAIRALNRPDASTVPIIAMTANAFEEDIRQTKEAGMNAHLSKPVQTKEMIRAIANYLKR